MLQLVLLLLLLLLLVVVVVVVASEHLVEARGVALARLLLGGACGAHLAVVEELVEVGRHALARLARGLMRRALCRCRGYCTLFSVLVNIHARFAFGRCFGVSVAEIVDEVRVAGHGVAEAPAAVAVRCGRHCGSLLELFHYVLVVERGHLPLSFFDLCIAITSVIAAHVGSGHLSVKLGLHPCTECVRAMFESIDCELVCCWI